MSFRDHVATSVSTKEEINIILRPFVPELDQAIVYATWRNAAFYGSIKEPTLPAIRFFKTKTVEIKHIIKKSEITVACFEDDEDMIIGYSVYADTHLHFIYVKADYRGKGIGKLLMPKNIETVSSDLTKIGATLVDKKKLKFLN